MPDVPSDLSPRQKARGRVIEERNGDIYKCVATLLAALALTQTANAAAPTSNYQRARQAIYKVFGPYAAQAMRVAGCETGGTYDPRARNGSFLGVFQMGEYARERYGHGPSWLVQAAAAYLYFVESGRDWSPWTCRWAA